MMNQEHVAEKAILTTDGAETTWARHKQQGTWGHS